MNKSKIVAAVDIGSSKIKTLIAQVSIEPVTFEATINIVGVASSDAKGVKKGQIVDIEEAVESTILSVEAAERMAGYNLDRAFVSIGGAHVQSQNSTGVVAVSDPNGEVSEDDVARVIESARAVSLPASRQIIHVTPREYMVDGEAGVRDPVGMTGVRLEVDTHLISVSAPALKNLAKTVQEVGIDIEQMVFSGVAASYSTLSPTEKELGCVLIDIGAGTTSVTAYVDGAISYSGSLPIGARNVTNDLAIGMRVSLDVAEKIKLGLNKKKPTEKEERKAQVDLSEYGAKENKTVSKRTLTEGILKPRLNEIFTMLKADLEKAGLINKVPSGAVITGGGALTYGIEDSAKRVLSLPVRVAKPSGVGGLIDDIGDPSFAVPVGLILFGARNSTETSSQGMMPKNLKMPGGGVFGKIVETAKDLLP